MATAKKRRAATVSKNVITPDGDLIVCTGCRLGCSKDGWDAHWLELLTSHGVVYIVHEGNFGPSKEIVRLRDEMVKALLSPRTNLIDLRKNKKLMKFIAQRKVQ
jgi:hypothetical protein